MLGRVDKILSFVFSYLLALLVLSVVIAPMLLIALAILMRLGRPVIFTQLRSGQTGRSFRIYKFRTLQDTFDAHGAPLPDDERMTRLGNFLRRTSLDELPQLLNVLKGEMVLVGPRPLVPEHVALCGELAEQRHGVRPGITGWAQVNGRNALTWSQKFAYDVWYVQHRHFFLDIKILYKTVQCVWQQRGITSQTHEPDKLIRATTKDSH